MTALGQYWALNRPMGLLSTAADPELYMDACVTGCSRGLRRKTPAAAMAVTSVEWVQGCCTVLVSLPEVDSMLLGSAVRQ